jgi:hypothetical protein
MTSFHLFARLPVELQLNIWAMAAEVEAAEPRYIFLQYKKNIRIAPPALMCACHASRASSLPHYVQTFHRQIQDVNQYCWVNYDVDIVVMKLRDLLRFEGTETKLTRNLRVESKATADSNFWETASLEVIPNRYPEIRTFLVLVDQSLVDWAQALMDDMGEMPEQLTKADFRVVDVRSGEFITMENAERYERDWRRAGGTANLIKGPMKTYYLGTGRSYLYRLGAKHYPMDNCPLEKIKGWTFPLEHSFYWPRPEVQAPQEGTENGDVIWFDEKNQRRREA